MPDDKNKSVSVASAVLEDSGVLTSVRALVGTVRCGFRTHADVCPGAVGGHRSSLRFRSAFPADPFLTLPNRGRSSGTKRRTDGWTSTSRRRRCVGAGASAVPSRGAASGDFCPARLGPVFASVCLKPLSLCRRRLLPHRQCRFPRRHKQPPLDLAGSPDLP